MKKQNYFNRFYLDKEKDIVITLYKENEDELNYIIETPNHHTGNLITNLAKVCKVETKTGENDMRIIKGRIPASINGDNEEVYIFRLGGIKIANIYSNGTVEMKAKIPAITKTLMAQTKSYKLDINKTIVKSYVYKKSKFRTDLHTHMNAMLPPDALIALGIKHQIRYPLYYINKLGLKITEEQTQRLEIYRGEIEQRYIYSDLEGKILDRRIKDETYINFADLILNNLENAEENINKIRNSLCLIKDGQAVFTNLEKLYVYRYVFCKGRDSKIKIDYTKKDIEKLPDEDVKEYMYQMLKDGKKGSKYEKNSILQDKLLWISREYQKQGIQYVEIANTDLTKKGEKGTFFLEQIHEILPVAEKETGVAIRFLAPIRRVWLTPVEIREALDVIKTLAKSPYVVGSDIIGEEINDISEFKDVIKELVEYAIYEDKEFTVRIHAGENDAYKDNVIKSIECIKNAIPEGKKAPRFRIGHGLYIEDLDSENGKRIIKEMKDIGATLEFQLSSNVRLNNLTEITKHPIRKYLENGIKCVQGTDGFGMYGTDTFEEQIALQNLLELNDTDFMKMREVEDEIIENSKKYFKEKSKAFEKLLNGRTITESLLELEERIFNEDLENKTEIKIGANLKAAVEVLKEKITKLPEEKVPVIIAGGSFNSQGRETVLNESAKNALRELVEKLDDEKAYFVVGHKMQGYEKALIDLSRQLHKKFQINAIVPKMVSEEVSKSILKNELDGVCISTEPEELGIYKSFNYEIFERRSSIVLAFDGNSPVANLVQEAKNGKGKSKIYVNKEVDTLREKAKSLDGYVVEFDKSDSIAEKILKDNPELRSKKSAFKMFEV